MEDPQFDFLKDAVQKIPDVVADESAPVKEKRSKSKKLSSSTASLMSSQEDDEDEDEEEEDEEEEDEEEEEEERKPKRPPAKKPRKAPAQAKRQSTAGMETVIRVNPQPAVAPAPAAPAAKVKEEAALDDRPVVVSAGLVAAPLASKLQAMDDDYDMAQ